MQLKALAEGSWEWLVVLLKLFTLGARRLVFSKISRKNSLIHVEYVLMTSLWDFSFREVNYLREVSAVLKFFSVISSLRWLFEIDVWRSTSNVRRGLSRLLYARALLRHASQDIIKLIISQVVHPLLVLVRPLTGSARYSPNHISYKSIVAVILAIKTIVALLVSCFSGGRRWNVFEVRGQACSRYSPSWG